MSDKITYTLAGYEYSVYKYIAYGKVRVCKFAYNCVGFHSYFFFILKVNEVIPFLIRRAQENSSMLDGRVMVERKLLWNEITNRLRFRRNHNQWTS